MMKTRNCLGLWVLGCCCAWAFGATATFVPLGPTTVEPGTDVSFDVILNVATLSSFDAADVVIGSPNVNDLQFAYAPEWDSAFLNVTGPVNDVGFYAQDVFVGGNNPSAVGTSLRIGTVTLKTQGLTEGTYSVQINNAVDGGVSKLSRGDLRDPLAGSATINVQCAIVDADCDGDRDLLDYADMSDCSTGPEHAASAPCLRFDTDADSDFDLLDIQVQFNQFTGSR